MDTIEHLTTILENNTTASIWADFVPESEQSPAISVINLANGVSRDLAGTAGGQSSSWRLTVVAGTTAEVILLVKQLEKLDNTAQTEFQRMRVDYVLMEPKQPEQSYRRAFVDVKVYK